MFAIQYIKLADSLLISVEVIVLDHSVSFLQADRNRQFEELNNMPSMYFLIMVAIVFVIHGPPFRRIGVADAATSPNLCGTELTYPVYVTNKKGFSLKNPNLDKHCYMISNETDFQTQCLIGPVYVCPASTTTSSTVAVTTTPTTTTTSTTTTTPSTPDPMCEGYNLAGGIMIPAIGLWAFSLDPSITLGDTSFCDSVNCNPWVPLNYAMNFNKILDPFLRKCTGQPTAALLFNIGVKCTSVTTCDNGWNHADAYDSTKGNCMYYAMDPNGTLVNNDCSGTTSNYLVGTICECG